MNKKRGRFLAEVVNTFKYIRRSLSLSMRRRISFDYLVMYLIVSVITLLVFTMGYNLIQVKSDSADMEEQVFNLAILKDRGDLSELAFTETIHQFSREEAMGIQLIVTPQSGDMEAYTLKTDYVSDRVYEMRYVENIWLFFGQGLIKNTEVRQFAFDDVNKSSYSIQTIQKFNSPTRERSILILAIMISQIIGITIMSIVGSFRLRQVFMPVYGMTKTAEKITINNMDAKLDVNRAEYELKDLARTFNDMIERIRTDYVKQKRFVSDVSHELRTPISIVNGYARMLDRWGKKDEAILEESIDAIKSETKNMQILVENLLTLVRSDNQTLVFEKDQFMLNEMGQELMKDMMLIDEGRHHFSTQIDEAIKVCLDEAKVKQTIRIFLDNAIKYTPEGGQVTLSMKKLAKHVEISIKDSGIGINKEDLPHLFERFYRSDESRTRETGGHGLGLAIAKAMIIGQEGVIRVKSKINEGSTFILTLPISCDK